MQTLKRWLIGDIADPLEAAREALYQLVFTAFLSAAIAWLQSPEVGALVGSGGAALTLRTLIGAAVQALRDVQARRRVG
jgi:hypothetical protein